jgi:hypothetical protein
LPLNKLFKVCSIKTVIVLANVFELLSVFFCNSSACQDSEVSHSADGRLSQSYFAIFKDKKVIIRTAAEVQNIDGNFFYRRGLIKNC